MTVAELLNGAQYETLELTVRERILTLTIARPKVLNALSTAVIDELRAVVGDLRARLGRPDESGARDWSIRGIIVTGAGDKAFVAGGDIGEMSTMSSSEAESYAGLAQELTSWLEQLPVPIVAAVNGYALGGGCELSLACDVIFASENAVFGQPEVLLGLIPGFGGTVRLQKVVGPQIARDLIFTGRRIDATEAHHLGLVARVYDDRDALMSAAWEFLETVSVQSPVAVASSKRTLRAVEPLGVDDGLEIERHAFAECFESNDMREGTQAFLDKRPPEFLGR